MTPIVIYLVIYFSIFLLFCENNLLSCGLVLFSLHTRLTVCLCVFLWLPIFLPVCLFVKFFIYFLQYSFKYFYIYLFCLFLVYPYIFSHIRSLDNLLLLFVCLFLESLIHTFQCEKPRNPSRSCKPFGFHGRLHHVQWASKKGKLYFALLF